MVTIVPASAHHLAAMTADDGSGLRLYVGRRVYGSLQAQLLCSEAYAFVSSPDDLTPFCVAGAFPFSESALELWCCLPGRLAADQLLALVRFTRMAVRRRGKPVFSFIVSGNRAGERLARLVGLAPTGGAVGRFREWSGS